MKTQKLTILSMFTTISLAIFALESLLPPLLPIPGAKLGLSNIITLIVLRNYKPIDTFLVLLMRILLSSFFFGQAVSLLYSLTGGILCFLAMLLTNYLLKNHYIFLTSIIGAIFHNLGQLGIAFFITKVSGVLIYLPFLFLSGILTGLFTGLCANFAQIYLMPAILRFRP